MATETEENETEETEETEETSKGNGEKKLSQAEVTRIMTREKQQGSAAGRAALLKELGIDDPKEAARLIELAKTKESESLSETDKALKKAKDDAEAAEADRKEAAQNKLNSRIERSLLANGLQLDKKDEEKAEKQIARAVRLLDLDLDADQDAIRAAVKELKSEMPTLFAEPEDEEGEETSPERTGRNDPGRPPRKAKPAGTAKDRAAKLLAERHPTSVKKT